MGQKVNPNGFRLGVIRPWHARWFADKGYKQLVHEDLQIRQAIAGRHINAGIAEVDIDRASGKIWARKFTVAHDCGQIINPDGLRHTIEGNVVQGISRTLWEEVKFDANNVTSVDWMTYPILDITETPEAIEVALVNHPELPPTGAGEPSIRPVAAAIANAIFDATGVRIRRVPFSPDRVKQALS